MCINYTRLCVINIEVTVNTCICTDVFTNNKGPIRWDNIKPEEPRKRFLILSAWLWGLDLLTVPPAPPPPPPEVSGRRAGRTFPWWGQTWGYSLAVQGLLLLPCPAKVSPNHGSHKDNLKKNFIFKIASLN